jgi:hypothetical protein
LLLGQAVLKADDAGAMNLQDAAHEGDGRPGGVASGPLDVLLSSNGGAREERSRNDEGETF